MEAKLKEYRALRRRKELIENAKEQIEISKQKLTDLFVPKIFKNMKEEKNDDEFVLLETEDVPAELPIEKEEEHIELISEVSEVESLEVKQESWQYFTLKWALYLVIWLTLYVVFLKLQFGAVFFVVSILIGIYLNTRTSPKKKGEVSAYSVFNQNCVSIDGTLKAEQFEREIRYGAGSVR